MTEEVTIRELKKVEEMLAAFPLFAQGSSHLEETLFQQRLAAMVGQGNYRCIGAYSGSKLGGISGFWIGTQLWCGRYIEADHVVVDRTLRSSGIGTRLMAWIEVEGERAGCNVFRVTMMLGKERTHAFYERNGFFDDGLLMVKALTRGRDEFPQYVPLPPDPK